MRISINGEAVKCVEDSCGKHPHWHVENGVKWACSTCEDHCVPVASNFVYMAPREESSKGDISSDFWTVDLRPGKKNDIS